VVIALSILGAPIRLPKLATKAEHFLEVWIPGHGPDDAVQPMLRFRALPKLVLDLRDLRFEDCQTIFVTLRL
jgi:hypothetical protein